MVRVGLGLLHTVNSKELQAGVDITSHGKLLWEQPPWLKPQEDDRCKSTPEKWIHSF